MDDDAKKLAVVGDTEPSGVASYGVERDVDVAPEETASAVIEGDYIRKVVMLKKLAVDAEDFCVVAEDIVERVCDTVVRLSHLGNPLLK